MPQHPPEASSSAPFAASPVIIDVEEVIDQPDPEVDAATDFVETSESEAETDLEPEPDADFESNGGHAPLVAEILAAAIFLTRLPVPFDGRIGRGLFSRSMGWFPLIGAGLGLGAGVVYGLLGGFGLTPLLAAALTIGLLIAVTGALHEDGLADTADSLGADNRERRLEIMRDSRIGSYGTLALIASVLVRVAAVAALPTTWGAIKALVVAGAVSRAALVAVSHWLPPARRDGLAASLAEPARGATILALGLALGLALLLLRTKIILVVLVAAAVTVVMMRLARIHVGGHTGDVLGATQQAVEIAVLVMMVGLR
jgi:adenosylcobinamide-GDP ribazoletransferase